MPDTMTALEKQIDGYRTEAAKIADVWSRERNAIKSDTSLSDTGKQQKLDALYTQHALRMAELDQSEINAINARKKNLETRAFGNAPKDASALIALRDAQDRADRLEDPQKALTLLHRAEMNQDASLAQAVVIRAIENNWSDVTTEYTKTRPDVAAAFAELGAINGHLNSTKNAFARMHYMLSR